MVDSNLKLHYESKVDFDADLGKYGIEKGVLTNPSEGEIFAPVAMWLEAVDLVLQRLKDSGLNFSNVKGLAGAGMQHGTVFWSKDAEELLKSLDPARSIVEQLAPEVEGEHKQAFSHPHSPNWQDASTQKQCDEFDAELGDPETLAEVTGSKAHHVSVSLSYECAGLMPGSASADLRFCDGIQSTPRSGSILLVSPWCRLSWHPFFLAGSPLWTLATSAV